MRRLGATLPLLGLVVASSDAVAAGPDGAHAYVIEHRPLDHCAPPDCRLEARRLAGNVLGEGPDAKAAGYAIIGSDRHELFAKRAIGLGAGEALVFELGRSDDPSMLKLSLASANPRGGVFEAVVEVRGDGAVLLRRAIAGQSRGFALGSEPADFGQEERYFTRLREALPSRRDRPITVMIRNEGTDRLAVAAPLVLRRIEGRAARHVVLVVFDAVPYPLLLQLFTRRDDRATRWLASWVGERGLVFSQAMSPGQLTGSFVRRFFKGDFYRLDGEPSLFGQGFDETPPERAAGPVARLAEHGFVTIATGSNLYLTPVLSRVGFDSVYNLESTLDLPPHPPVVSARFGAEMAEHAEDDALFVVWYGNTHIPWRDGKADAPPIVGLEIPEGDLDFDVLRPIWRNLLEAVDSLGQARQSAQARAPGADRLWILGADHGHTFTLESRDRPWRLTREAVERGHMHCCLSTQQETRTPFVILGERGPARRGVVTAPVSAMAIWRAIEDRFGLDLDLPHTSALALPGVAEPKGERFDVGVLVSVGNSGALGARLGDLSYRSYEPACDLAPVWSVSPRVALLLAGTPARAGDVVAEELYDLASDPGERVNLAAERFDDLLLMRERVTHWLAQYVDTPEHPRYRYRLGFGERVTLRIAAPRSFGLGVDGGSPAAVDRRAVASGSRFEIDDADAPLGVVDLAAESMAAGVVVRCASSGLPLARIDADRPRLDLALARTNCPEGQEGAAAAPRAGEALFDAILMSSRGSSAGRAGGQSLPELRDALRRWGYVRDK